MKRVRSWLWQSTGELPAFTACYSERYVEALLCGLGRNLSPPWQLELWVDETWHTFMESWLESHPLMVPFLKLVKFQGAGCGGWSRMMEIYDPAYWPEAPSERVLAVGLDTVFTHNCDWLFEWNEEPCGFIRDPLVPSTISNSVSTFNQQGAAELWKAFLMSCQDGFEGCKMFDLPSEMMVMRRYWGLFNLAKPYACLEEKPECILSYKVHLKTLEDLCKSCIVFFHGSPKPHDLPEGDPLREMWNPIS